MIKIKAPTNFDEVKSLEFIWECLNKFNPENGLINEFTEETWDDICTAMAWIEDACGVELIEGILQYKKKGNTK